MSGWGLRVGTKIEMEHTKDKSKARRIAQDHLKEFGDRYYEMLIPMEACLKKEKAGGKKCIISHAKDEVNKR